MYILFRLLRGDRRPANKPGDNHVDQTMVGHPQTNVEQILDKLWANLARAFELEKLSKIGCKIDPGRLSGVQNRPLEGQNQVLRVKSLSEFQKINFRSQL